MKTNMDEVYEAQYDEEDSGVVRGIEKEGYDAIDDDKLGLNNLDSGQSRAFGKALTYNLA